MSGAANVAQRLADICQHSMPENPVMIRSQPLYSSSTPLNAGFGASRRQPMMRMAKLLAAALARR